MILLASAFGTFALFLLAGLGALLVTALLEGTLRKEATLLGYVLVLLGLTLLLYGGAPVRVSAQVARDVRLPAPEVAARAPDPLLRPSLDLDVEERNPFRKHSDTHDLPPIELDPPPWLDLATMLPPTVPGPAPGARWMLRGPAPRLELGDETTIPEIPLAAFEEYRPSPEDVFDWVIQGNKRMYVYILALREGGRRFGEFDVGFRERLLRIVRGEHGSDDLEVEFAVVGDEAQAARRLEPTEIAKLRRQSASPRRAGEMEWHLRRTVVNLHDEVLRRSGIADPAATPDYRALVRAAGEMAQVGRTGKEEGLGWSYAASLLEHAITEARQRAAPVERADILRELVQAYQALGDEDAVLRSLTEYAQTSPERPEPWLLLGRVHLHGMGLVQEAIGYLGEALSRAAQNEEAQITMGDAWTWVGRHRDALAHYQRAGTGPRARVRRAEAFLRLGDLASARSQLAGAAADDGDPRGLLVRGAIHYAAGEVEQARAAFEQASTSEHAEAWRWRAQATYDLGLTLVRAGRGDAALAAFQACEDALARGSEPRRGPDEAVSPSFGRALVSWATGKEGAMREELALAREEAPGVSYHEAFAAMVAGRQGNLALAMRALQTARTLAGDDRDLDVWTAWTRLGLARQALAAGTPADEVAPDFEAAWAYAERAAQTEGGRDKRAFEMRLREAWIRMHAEHLSTRRRFEAAREVADDVLSRIDREQPGALAIRGYCQYRLGEYDKCMQDFGLVKQKEDAGPWQPWRQWALDALEKVKHWRNLEEKIVVFEGAGLSEEWSQSREGRNVQLHLEDGAAHVRTLRDKGIEKDGSLEDPSFYVESEKLFGAGSFESVRVRLRIPTRDARGGAVNNVTFGVQVLRAGRGGGRGTGPASGQGIGLFYDRGKLAVRVGGGRDAGHRDAALHRGSPEVAWPDAEWVEVRIERGAEDGALAIYLDPPPPEGAPDGKVFEDVLSGFRSGQVGAKLWIGGWGDQAQALDVQIRDLRVVRKKS